MRQWINETKLELSLKFEKKVGEEVKKKKQEEKENTQKLKEKEQKKTDEEEESKTSKTVDESKSIVNGKWTVHTDNTSHTTEIDVKDNKFKVKSSTYTIIENDSTKKLEFSWLPDSEAIQSSVTIDQDEIKWIYDNGKPISIVWKRIKESNDEQIDSSSKAAEVKKESNGKENEDKKESSDEKADE
jgi:hypothetical protein